MRRWLLLFFITTALCSGYAQSLTGITEIKLKNVRGKGVAITASDKNTVVIFLGTDCPISQKYIARIKEIVERFEATADFYGVFPEQFSMKEIRRFKKDYKISIPFLRDAKMEMAHFLGATVTPEAFLLDDKLELQYRGAIDNWFYELGKNRRTVTEQYLIDALTALDQNQEPPLKQTEAIGCFIQMSHGMKHH
ncbi:MAG TPA: redoxin domain-containing protein [Cyclobacteriaceae bacterium]|nr:redoxin domain-containing protein [Cyclobacteriaceae bacterium]